LRSSRSTTAAETTWLARTEDRLVDLAARFRAHVLSRGLQRGSCLLDFQIS